MEETEGAELESAHVALQPPMVPRPATQQDGLAGSVCARREAASRPPMTTRLRGELPDLPWYCTFSCWSLFQGKAVT